MSKSRPTQGMVTVETRAHKQDSTLVMKYQRIVLVPKRGHSVDDKVLAAENGE